MAEITMRRESYTPSQKDCTHAGLMLERGFDKWDTENNKYNDQKTAFYDQLTDIKASELYEKAYDRWEATLLQNHTSCKAWAAKLEGRLYLGLGEVNPLESAITLHHSYGVPFIPGSAIKGVVHHALVAHFKDNLTKNNQAIINALFGREADEKKKQDSGDTGYIIFNDAWWIPKSKATPLVKEIITVHHQDYYAGKQAATDFDSPNPNPQLAVQGSFLFSVAGETSWAEYALKVLQQVLEHKGIGAKTASGYGCFSEDKVKQKIINDDNLNQQLNKATPEEKIALKVAELTLENLPEKLGKNRNGTKKEIMTIGEKYWQDYISQVEEKFCNDISGWGSAGGNKQKAYKNIKNES